MNVVKKGWFPVAVTLLVGVTAFNVHRIYRARSHDGGNPEGTTGQSRPVPVETAQPGPAVPRTITLAVAPKAAAQLDAEAITRALQSMGPVGSAHLEGEAPATARLTLVEPVKLSQLSDRLALQGAEVVEGRSLLRGELRLHVSGMS